MPLIFLCVNVSPCEAVPSVSAYTVIVSYAVLSLYNQTHYFSLLYVLSTSPFFSWHSSAFCFPIVSSGRHYRWYLGISILSLLSSLSALILSHVVHVMVTSICHCHLCQICNYVLCRSKILFEIYHLNDNIRYVFTEQKLESIKYQRDDIALPTSNNFP